MCLSDYFFSRGNFRVARAFAECGLAARLVGAGRRRVRGGDCVRGRCFRWRW